MSPAATALLTSVRFVDEDGVERFGYVAGPGGHARRAHQRRLGRARHARLGQPLGDVRRTSSCPPSALRGGFPTGEPVPYLERNLASGLFHAVRVARHRRGRVRAGRAVPERIGDDAARRGCSSPSRRSTSPPRAALIARAATLIDDHHAANPASDGTDEEITALFAEGQAAKTFVNEAATRVVDRALALSGGAGYLNGSPLARAYRDVRAGAFMHPLGANRAYAFLGDVALGREPALH